MAVAVSITMLMWQPANAVPKPAPKPTGKAASKVSGTPVAKKPKGIQHSASKPMPRPTPTVSKDPYVQPTVAAGNIEECKLPDQSSERTSFGNTYGGFPALGSDLPHQGTIKLALVPVDFGDLPGQPAPVARVADQMKTFSDWYEMVSDGRVKIEWVTYEGWVRLPGKASQFAMPSSTWNEGFLRAALAAADPVVDFTGVQSVNFLLPTGQTIIDASTQGFPWVLHGGVQTDEGLIRNYTLPGAYFDRAQTRNYWSYWAHEVGHMFQLAHLTPPSGTGAFFGYDLMGSQDGPTRTLSSWMRFIAGWLSDNQVYCKSVGDLQSTTLMLNPVNNRTPGLKAAIIKISPTKAVVVESRRYDERFDCKNSPDRNGILVYTADTSLGHMDDMLHLALVPGREKVFGGNCGVPPIYEAIMKPGESVTADGVKVDFVTTGRYDTVKIAMASS